MKINLSFILRIALLIVFVSVSLFFFYSSPEKLILLIGVKNAFIMIFVLAFVGGLTTFSGVPYHAVLVLLASGGLDPFLLGLSAAIGVMLGDTTSYFLGYSGRDVLPPVVKRILQRFFAFCLNHQKILPIAFFLYGSFVPFSNDFIVISMGLARYPFWKVMIPLGLGNLVFNISLAYLVLHANDIMNGVLFYL